MSEKFTQEELFQRKLASSSVPGWEAGWERLEPLLNEPRRDGRVAGFAWWKGLGTAVALALILVLSVWLVFWREEAPPSTTSLANTPESYREGREGRSSSTYRTGTGSRARMDIRLTRGKTGDSGLRSEAAVRIPARRPDPLCALPRIKEIVLPSRQLPESEITWVPALPPFPRADSSILTAAGTEAGHKKNYKGMHLAIGLRANGGSSFGNAPSNYNPVLKGTPVDVYPFASVSKRFSRRFSMEAGIALAAPVDVRDDALHRSISDPFRAMASNVAQSQDSISLNRLYYIDLPVVLNYHLGSRFSIGSGLQVSVLEKVIGKKQRLDYDNYGVVALALPVHPDPGNLTHEKETSGTIRPVDLRWLVGLHYQFGRHWKVSLQYQCGLTDISSNKAFLNDHVNRNNVLSAGLEFVIK